MKKLKKIIAATMLAGVMALAVGCSGKSDDAETLDVAKMQTNLTEANVLLNPSMESPATEHWIFEEVKDKIEDGFVNQAMINVKLQDVIVVKTTDTDAVVKALENYKENSLKMFGDGYGGEENITAVADSKLEVVGDVVYFIATENAQDVENALLGKK